jgi:hypothetical protein
VSNTILEYIFLANPMTICVAYMQGIDGVYIGVRNYDATIKQKPVQMF